MQVKVQKGQRAQYFLGYYNYDIWLCLPTSSLNPSLTCKQDEFLWVKIKVCPGNRPFNLHFEKHKSSRVT